MKKGFTLIELLAVIVILSVIALIATPLILGVVEKAKVGAVKASAQGYIESLEMYIGTSELNKKTKLKANEKYNVTEITTIKEEAIEALNDLIEIKGEEPTGEEDYIKLDEQYKVKEGKLTYNEYVVTIEEGEIIVTKIGEKVLVEDITLNLTEEIIERGNKVKIKATFQPSNATNKKLIYKSSNEEIVKVSEKGEIEAVGIGKGKITVTSEENKEITKEIKITVIAPEYATSVRIEKEDKKLYVGDTIQLTGILEPNDVTSKILTWTSTDIEIASVSDTGLVTGKKAGTTNITATTKNNVSATIEIEVLKGIPTKEEASSTDTHKGIVYLDPTNLNRACNKLNSVSTTGTKTGCMKWYIYDEDDSNYTMILDHNTTARVKWTNIESTLLTDTNTWNSSLKARIMSADEAAKIIGADKDDTLKWNSSKTFGTNVDTQISYLYLDGSGNTYTGWQTQQFSTKGASKYSWLYDRTHNECESYGCANNENPSSNTYGYWLKEQVKGNTNYAWAISRLGRINNDTIAYGNDGVRPVITVQKINISD